MTRAWTRTCAAFWVRRGRILLMLCSMYLQERFVTVMLALKAGACFCNCVCGFSRSCVDGLVLIYGSPRVARVEKQFPARTLGGVMFFVEDDLRDAFFVGVAVVVDCLFTFSQSCSPHTQWTMAERALLTMATRRQLIEMELLNIEEQLLKASACFCNCLCRFCTPSSIIIRGPYSFFLKSSLVSAGIIGHETGNVTCERM